MCKHVNCNCREEYDNFLGSKRHLGTQTLTEEVESAVIVDGFPTDETIRTKKISIVTETDLPQIDQTISTELFTNAAKLENGYNDFKMCKPYFVPSSPEAILDARDSMDATLMNEVLRRRETRKSVDSNPEPTPEHNLEPTPTE